MGLALAEFAAEALWAPGLKSRWPLVSVAGLALVVAGEALRKARRRFQYFFFVFFFFLRTP